MANVEITENTIIRSLVRKGTNSQRQQIVLEEGELGYTTDTERLFVGNGSGTGEAAGVKYLGDISDFSLVAAESPMPGDFFKFDGNLYARKAGLSGSTAAESLNASSVEGYDVLGIAAKVGTGLQVDTGNLNVLVDDQTIQFTDDNKLQVKEIPFSKLSSISPVSLLGNSGNTEAAAEGLAVNQNSVIGRKTDNTLTNISFKDIVTIGNEELNNASDKYNSAGVQTGAGFNVDDTGRMTWAGVPHLHVNSTSGESSFALPNDSYIVKIYMTGGAATGAPGGALIFYAKISSDPSMRTISYRVGESYRQKGFIAESTWLKFYDSSNTLQTFYAKGGSSVQVSGQAQRHNTIPGGAALGHVIDIPPGKGDNRSYDSEASFWGSEGPGSAGSTSGYSQDGSVVIEYYKAL